MSPYLCMQCIRLRQLLGRSFMEWMTASNTTAVGAAEAQDLVHTIANLLQFLGDVVECDAAELFLQRLLRSDSAQTINPAPRPRGVNEDSLKRYHVELNVWLAQLMALLRAHRQGAVVVALTTAALEDRYADVGPLVWNSDEELGAYIMHLEESVQLVRVYSESLLTA